MAGTQTAPATGQTTDQTQMAEQGKQTDPAKPADQTNPPTKDQTNQSNGDDKSKPGKKAATKADDTGLDDDADMSLDDDKLSVKLNSNSVVSRAAHNRVLGEAKDRYRASLAEKDTALAEREAFITKLNDEVMSLKSQIEEREHTIANKDSMIKGLTTERDGFKAKLGDFQAREFENVMAQINGLPETQQGALKAALADEIAAKDGSALAKKLAVFQPILAPQAGKTGSEPLKGGNANEPKFGGKPVRLLQEFNTAVMRGGAEAQAKAAAAMGLTVVQANALLNRFESQKK